MPAQTTRADDERLLQMLHLRDHEGLDYSDLADRYGTQRRLIRARLNRVDLATSREIGPALDGSQSPLWWRRPGGRA